MRIPGTDRFDQFGDGLRLIPLGFERAAELKIRHRKTKRRSGGEVNPELTGTCIPALMGERPT